MHIILTIALCIQIKHLLAHNIFAKSLFYLSSGWLDPWLQRKVTWRPFFHVGASNGQIPKGLQVQFSEDGERKVWMKSWVSLWPLEAAHLAWEAQAVVMETLLLAGAGSSPLPVGTGLSEANALIAAEGAVIYSSLCEKRTRMCICK